jgi:serine/threonine protein kinase
VRAAVSNGDAMSQPEERTPPSNPEDPTFRRTPLPNEAQPGPSASPVGQLYAGRYEIREELARGGMGRVLLAHDRSLDRPVAIKEALDPSPELLQRFEREVRMTARLQHPAIVGLFEAGQAPGGHPFFVMRRVAGTPMDAQLRGMRTLAERLTLLPNLIAAVEALAYAHHQRIIHRDLKPSNLLIGRFGDTVVIDWGLARSLDAPVAESAAAAPGDAAPAVTLAGAVMGTPSYMSPEQARGAELDARTDVYALGAILYELISGAPPYTGTSAQAILAQLLERPPATLTAVETGAPEISS